MSPEKMRIQLERLQRHYMASAKTYDAISLLDLSHSLRVWDEMEESIFDVFPEFEKEKPFTSASPSKALLKKIGDDPYVVSYMPGGVTTWAEGGNTLIIPPSLKADNVIVGGRIRRLPNGATEVGRFFVSGASHKGFNAKLLEAETVKRCGYSGWLSSDVVRLNYYNSANKLTAMQISRKMLIKRVANTLDASHPSSSTDKTHTNKFDEPVHYLMEFGWGGIPLPYFILLKIAQDLTKVAQKLILDR